MSGSAGVFAGASRSRHTGAYRTDRPMNASSLPTAGRRMFDELLLQPNLRLRVGEHIVDVGALRVVTRPEHPRLTSKATAVLI